MCEVVGNWSGYPRYYFNFKTSRCDFECCEIPSAVICLVNNSKMVLDIKEIKDNGAFGGPVNFLWWIVKSVCIPLSLPWLIYRFISNMHLKTRMLGLQDKVTIVRHLSLLIIIDINFHCYWSAATDALLCLTYCFEWFRVVSCVPR